MAYITLQRTTGDTCGDNRVGLPFRWSVKESTFEKPFPNAEVVGLQVANPISITQNDIDTFPDEITIERTGSCNRCGYCCGWINKKPAGHCCVHIIKTGNQKGECGIYDQLEDYCEICEQNHADCIPPPSSPYHKWNDLCGYTWTVTTPGNCLSGKEIIRMYWSTHQSLEGRWIRE